MLLPVYVIQARVACLNSQQFVKLSLVLGKTNTMSQQTNQGINISSFTMILTFIVKVVYS